MLVCEGLLRRWQSRDGVVVGLDEVTLGFERGRFTVLVGRSGCGKTTLLRLLGGLLQPSSGTIRPTDPTPPPPRIGFALAGRLPRGEVAAQVEAALAMIGLTGVERVLPHRLSGGMASRVGLARALVSDPDLLLLDEPFASLDALTRRRLQMDLVDLWTARWPTVVFVTHDVEEAVLLADRIHRIERGRIAATLTVDLPRPRRADDPTVVALRAEILAGLEADTLPVASDAASELHRSFNR